MSEKKLPNISQLKPYPEYKESGSKWLGSVPAKWDVKNLSSLLSKKTERNRDDLPLLSVAREKGVFVRSLTDTEENHNVIPEDLTNYKVARAGDLVINKMKAWQGSMGIAPCDGIVSPAYYVFGFRIANHSFGQKLLRSKPYVAHFGQASDGVRIGQWDLSLQGMRRIPVLLPSSDEQAAIVRFLDYTNKKIDSFIRAKKKLIGLLNEQKQAIIQQAVTRGLNPDVKLKASGIPWLGDIPEDWEIRPIKQVLIQMDYGTSESSTDNGKYRVLTMGHIQNGHIVIPGKGGINLIPAGLSLRKNDLLFNRTNSPDLVGKVGIFEGPEIPPITFASYLVRLRVRPEYNPFWLNYLLNSFRFWAFARSQAYISLHQANLNSSRYGRMSIPIPPRSVQNSIVNQIKEQTGVIDNAVTRAEREITLMQEYRARLTADIVTGKLDVREAAARLPEVIESSDSVPDALDSEEEIDEVDGE